ncbi:MAG: hypothetical protein AYK19_02850 [Theionarchaea archaeon DG-70-1]|nr:MAG: hypothetical protein AYK19_02850 [Theionarchaea archaeon DG-70-1]
MLDYFNLNNRASKTWGKEAKISPEVRKKSANNLESLATELEGASLAGISRDASGIIREASGIIREEAPPSAPAHLSGIRQAIMYLGIFIGILLSTTLSEFKSEEIINISLTIGKVAISAIIAFMIVPQVYEKVNANPDSPFIVQLGLFVQNGVFWSVAVDLIAETL